MNRLIIIAILFSLTFFACQKDKIKLRDVTQTDANGNIIGEPAEGQWELENLGSAQGTAYNVFFGEVGAQSSFDFLGINLSDFNYNCDLSGHYFNFVIYPNPVNFNETDNKLFFNLDTDLNFIKYYLAVVKNDEIITSEIGDGNLPSFLYPNYGKDFTLYYMFLTSDSCAFYGHGNVKITK